MKRITLLLSFLLLFCGLAANAQPKKKRILAIGQVKGFQHDATSNGLATMWKLGKESGLWDTYIRTDTQLITKKKLTGNAKNIDFFGVFNFPAVMYLTFLNNHMIHHRGQLSTYLRAMGGKVPSIYGGSADEPFQAAAAH